MNWNFVLASGIARIGLTPNLTNLHWVIVVVESILSPECSVIGNWWHKKHFPSLSSSVDFHVLVISQYQPFTPIVLLCLGNTIVRDLVPTQNNMGLDTRLPMLASPDSSSKPSWTQSCKTTKDLHPESGILIDNISLAHGSCDLEFFQTKNVQSTN